jgi:hypothetical protein
MTGAGPNPPNVTDPQYDGVAGRGGTSGAAGSRGRAVIFAGGGG